MKSINKYIQEKYLIDDNYSSKVYTDEELRQDYDKLGGWLTKTEKQVYAQKYGINSNKAREIQIAILNELRNNRQNKKEFTDEDLRNFTRYDIKEKEYEKYLDQEPIEFVYALFKKYETTCKKRNLIRYISVMNQRDWNYRMSISDKYSLKKYVQLKKYLEKHHYKL